MVGVRGAISQKVDSGHIKVAKHGRSAIFNERNDMISINYF